MVEFLLPKYVFHC